MTNFEGDEAQATLSPDGKKFSSSIWRIATGDKSAARLTRSAEGESSPEFLPDGGLLFLSGRPGPATGEPQPGDDQDKPALWLLPAAGGEARRVLAPPSGVAGLATARDAMLVALVSPVLPGVTEAGQDAERRKARSDAGVTAILHEAPPVRYWDHDLGPALPHAFTLPEASAQVAQAPGPAKYRARRAVRLSRTAGHSRSRIE